MSPSRCRPEVSRLESRLLFAAAYPNAAEQYLLELINRARADPTAEAARYGIDLNEGLSAGTISSIPKQPLALNPLLISAARGHSQWMIDTDTFAHAGSGGSDPGDRMASAGYAFTGSWTWGENIAWRGSTGGIDLTSSTASLHEDLFVDEGIAGRGHRTNLMKADFREIGTGVVTGDFQGYNAAMATEDFATSGSSYFLTGVAYTDAVTDDNFYTPGEGLGGITITATRTSDNAVFTTQTWSSGGYSLALPSGTYSVTAGGGGLNGIVTGASFTLGSANVKRDFTPASSFATVSGDLLTVYGTESSDTFSFTLANNIFTARRGSSTTTIPAAGVLRIIIYGYAGDDAITIGSGIFGVYVDAGLGNDVITGGDGKDTITGGAGKDRIHGGLGDDRLNGNGGHDYCWGEAGKDRLYGGEGYDTLDGGSSTDRIWGDGGSDLLLGQSGNDYLYSRDNLLDTVYGGAGTDSAQLDLTDTRASIEALLA